MISINNVRKLFNEGDILWNIYFNFCIEASNILESKLLVRSE